MKKLLCSLLLCSAAILGKADTYYISPTGNDNNVGTSTTAAWKTTANVNTKAFKPGDNILFQAGATYSGHIIRGFDFTGAEGSPLTIATYGGGRATISSGTSQGIYIGGGKNIVIKNLVVKGAGYMTTTMWINGIDFYQESTSTENLENVTLDNVEVLGYGGFGISLATNSSRYGYRNVRVTNSLFHDNGMGGFQINGSWDGTRSLIRVSHKNVYVGYSKAYNNHGRYDYRSNWSGSGILVAGTEGGLVEYCEAYENGKDNGCSTGGPIGIWMDNSKYVIIQNSISHHNKGGGTKTDGGGFDIDGGCFGCVIQECDSYENEGCGYGLFQWQTGNTWSNDTIRNCTSTNDARNSKYGAFSFWGYGAAYKVTNAQIYGNRISMDKEGQGLAFVGNNFSNIQVHDNSFCIVAPGTFYSTLPSQVFVTNNSFPCMVLSIKSGSFNVKRTN